MSDTPKIRVGIDGGGTGSRFCILLPDGQVIPADGPPLQGSLMEPGIVAERIITTISNELEAKASGISSLTAGIAGFASTYRAEALENALASQLPNTALSIHSDVATTFAATFGKQLSNCFLLICGTGSVVVKGDTLRDGIMLYGGTGPGTIEPGSGRQIGLDFINHLRQLPADDERAIIRLNAEYDELSIEEWHERPAKLAPLCLKLASEGDSVAETIIQHHITKTLNLLNTALSGSSLSAKLALHGGLFNHDFFRNEMVNRLEKHHPEIHILNTPNNLAERIARPGFKAPHVFSTNK
ncbi:MAG: hypothetical protein LAT84_01320 [Balneolia bacterium]|nr:hypothetical protein [Balneolia bacterium]